MQRSIERWAGKPWLPWVVWLIGSSFISYQFSFQSSAAIMTTQWMYTFGLHAAGVGFLSSTFFYTYLLLQVPGGLLVDRCGVRKVLIVGVALFIVGLCIFATTTQFWVAILARLLMGMATAPAVAAGLCLGANWFPPSRFALIVGMSEMTGMIGAVFGEGVMSHWVNRLGWQLSLWFWVIAGVIMVIAMMYWVYDHPASRQQQSDSCQASPASWCVMRKNLRSIMSNYQVWFNGLFCGLTFSVNVCFSGLWSVPYLERVHGLPFGTSAWLAVLTYVGVMVGGPTMGCLSDHWGQPRILMRYASLVGTLLTVVFILMPVHHVIWLAAMMFAMGFFSAVYVIPFVNVKKLVPFQARGAAMSVVNAFCVCIGSLLLQPLYGWVLHHGLSHYAANGMPVYIPQAFQWAMWLLVACPLFAYALTFVMVDPAAYVVLDSHVDAGIE